MLHFLRRMRTEKQSAERIIGRKSCCTPTYVTTHQSDPLGSREGAASLRQASETPLTFHLMWRRCVAIGAPRTRQLEVPDHHVGGYSGTCFTASPFSGCLILWVLTFPPFLFSTKILGSSPWLFLSWVLGSLPCLFSFLFCLRHPSSHCHRSSSTEVRPGDLDGPLFRSSLLDSSSCTSTFTKNTPYTRKIKLVHLD